MIKRPLPDEFLMRNAFLMPPTDDLKAHAAPSIPLAVSGLTSVRDEPDMAVCHPAPGQLVTSKTLRCRINSRTDFPATQESHAIVRLPFEHSGLPSQR